MKRSSFSVEEGERASQNTNSFGGHKFLIYSSFFTQDKNTFTITKWQKPDQQMQTGKLERGVSHMKPKERIIDLINECSCTNCESPFVNFHSIEGNFLSHFTCVFLATIYSQRNKKFHFNDFNNKKLDEGFF